jgi:hypothetical protein
MSSTSSLLLTVRLEPSEVKVELHNPTGDPVRVWELANSWGGASWALHLTAAGSGTDLVLRPTKQPYTANVPRFLEVPARGHREVRLAPAGPEWTFGEDLSALQGVPLGVRVVLDIAPSQEAEEHHVATGRVESAEALSQPPHTWLFGAPAAR